MDYETEIGELIHQIHIKETETIDDFIFETIRPYCQNRTNVSYISKKELVEALKKQQPAPPIHGCLCRCCHGRLRKEANYCEKCGQKVGRR